MPHDRRNVSPSTPSRAPAPLPGLGGAPWRAPRRAATMVAGSLALAFAAPGVAQAAVTAQYGEGVLKVQGDALGNTIVVACNAGNVTASGATVEDAGAPVPCTEVTSISLGGGEGGDTLWVDLGGLPNASAALSGDDDHDTLLAFGGDEVELRGGAGNDQLDSGAAAATLDGGAGDDTIGGNGGADQLTFTGAASVDVNLGSNTAVATGAAAGSDSVDGIEVVVGTSGNDTLISDSSSQSLIGGGGDDSLRGNDGFDTLSGGAGDDTLRGDAGDDVLSGQGDDDAIFGGTGSDVVSGGAGTDSFAASLPAPGSLTATATTITGEGSDTHSDIELLSLTGSNAGNDTLELSGFIGDATLAGLSGNDAVRLAVDNTSRYSLNGGPGSDTLDLSGSGALTLTAAQLLSLDGPSVHEQFEVFSLSGGSGDDTLFSVVDPVTISGGAGNDSLRASGEAVMIGGTNNDTLQSLLTTDAVTIDGGPGTDVASVQRDSDLTLTSTGINGPSSTVGIASIDRAEVIDGNSSRLIDGSAFPGSLSLLGAGGNDTLLGGSAGDTLDGGIGEDSLEGGGGSDSLSGGGDRDSLLGGDGFDQLNPGSGPLGGLPEIVDGGADPDYLSLASTSASVQGGAGIDTLQASGGATIVATDTSLQGPELQATSAGVERVDYAGDGAPQLVDLTGLSLPARVNTGGGNDTILAGAGTEGDQFYGSGGDDLVVGPVTDADQTLTPSALSGAGSDTLDAIERVQLRGGAGASRLDASAFAGTVTLDGGGGPDTLLGGAGIDQLLGGEGDDQLDSRDGGVVDAVDCGVGSDQLLSDAADSQTACELVNGVASPTPPTPTEPPTPPVLPLPPASDPPSGGAPPAPLDGPVGDLTAPTLSALKFTVPRVSGRALKLRVRASCDEACTISGSARIVVTKKRRGKRTPKPVSIKLSGLKKPVTLAAGKRRTITFTLSAKSSRRTLSLLRQRTTARASLALALEARDAAGNRGQLTRNVRVLATKRR